MVGIAGGFRLSFIKRDSRAEAAHVQSEFWGIGHESTHTAAPLGGGRAFSVLLFLGDGGCGQGLTADECAGRVNPAGWAGVHRRSDWNLQE